MILRRLLRVAFRVSLLRAWSQREARWLLVTAGVVVVRLVQRSGARRRASGTEKAA